VSYDSVRGARGQLTEQGSGESNIAENNYAKVGLVSRDYESASRYLLIRKTNDVTTATADIVTTSSRCPQLGTKLCGSLLVK